MTYILSFILPIIFILSYNGFFVIVFNKKFGKALPFSLITMTLTLFISQLIFQTFIVGIVADLLVCTSFIILLFTKKRERLKGNFLTPGLFVFIAIYIFYYIIDFNRILKIWDEIAFWGPFTKEMFRLDKFYIIDEASVLIHKDYPPFISLFEVLWCKISTTCSDMNITIAYNVLMTSICIPYIAELIKGKTRVINIAKTFLLFLGAISILIGFGGPDKEGIFNTIYTDYFIGFLFALGIILFFEEDFFKEKYNYILLCLIGVTLVLSKQIGIVFYGVLVLAYFLKIISCRKELNENKRIDKECIKLIALICIPLVFFAIWKLQVDNYSIYKQFNYTAIETEKITDIFSNNNLTENQIQFTPKFIENLLNKNVTTLGINISYTVATAIIFIGLIAMFIYNKIKQQKEENKKVVFTGIILLITNVAYIIALYLSYMLFFRDIERTTVACFNRYITTLLIPEIIVVLVVFFNNFKNMKKAVLITIYSLIVIASASCIFSNYSVLSQNYMQQEEAPTIENITDTIYNS